MAIGIPVNQTGRIVNVDAHAQSQAPSADKTDARPASSHQSKPSPRANENQGRTLCSGVFNEHTDAAKEQTMLSSPSSPPIKAGGQKNKAFPLLDLPMELLDEVINQLIDPLDLAKSIGKLKLGLGRANKKLMRIINEHPLIKPHLSGIQHAQAKWKELWPSIEKSESIAWSWAERKKLEALLSKAPYLTREQRSLLLKKIQKERDSFRSDEGGVESRTIFMSCILPQMGPALAYFSEEERTDIFNDIMGLGRYTLNVLMKLESYSSAFSSSQLNEVFDLAETKKLSSSAPSQELCSLLSFLSVHFDRLSSERQEIYLDYAWNASEIAIKEVAYYTFSKQSEKQQEHTLVDLKKLVDEYREAHDIDAIVDLELTCLEIDFPESTHHRLEEIFSFPNSKAED